MATRKRMISPLIWEDPTFNKLSVGSRLLFIGMFSNADDEGYIRGDIGSLRRLVFGFDDNLPELPQWLEEIKSIKNIHFYEAEDEKYAHFLKWNEYQRQQKDRIQKSDYPKCSICLASATQMSTEVRLGKVRLGKDSKESSRFAPPPLEEVKNYCKERENGVNPQSFIDFYSSKGWMIGKNKMKDWKAAIRTWEQRQAKPVSAFKSKYQNIKSEVVKT